MNTPALRTATMAALALPPVMEQGAPDWVHLLPAREGAIRTFDGRGPYRLADAEAVIAASLEDTRGIPIDENHATDLAAPKGGMSPARGWIIGLEAREDGIWGEVEWTAAGRALVEDRSYRGLSPVFRHDQHGEISRLLRASLTNVPNLRGLTALHSEQDLPMTDMEKIAEALGLTAAASADEALAAIASMKGEGEAPALQSAMTVLGTALGVEADVDQVVAAAIAAKAGADGTVALQAQVSSLTAERDGLKAEKARTASEAYVDAEMAKGRVGLNATTRDTFVTLHMEQSVQAQKIVEGLSIVGPGATKLERKGEVAGGSVALNAEQLGAAKVLGISPEDYAKTLAAEKAIA